MASPLCIRGGRILDPVRGIDRVQDLWIQDGKIAGLGEDAPADVRSSKQTEVIPVAGAVICPGLVDIHVHLREPGQEEKETIETGTRAAARGGFTAVACMPNTSPPLDDRPRIEYVLKRARQAGHARVYPIAAVTQGQMGERLTEIEDLVDAGAVAVSDDGKPVRNAEIMRRALELTRRLGVPVIQHAEDPDLKGDGVMHEGWTSTRLGMKGIPDAAESVMVARDTLLAELTGGHVHVAHVSAGRSVDILRKAKARGIRMTAETAPHYLLLTEEAVEGFDPRTKMNPPLRSAKDRDALIEAVVDGTIDCLATDHAPHTEIEKDCDFDAAPFGIVGLETALGVYLKALVEPKHLSLPELILRMTANPLRVLGLPGGTLEAGTPADITIFDPARRWTVRASEFASMGRNTPFEGWELPGRVLLTMLDGRVTYRGDSVQASVR
ncbi:MAG TPA: dihydroorotase [Candidatus Polarisedimenticolia bacterium]|nr:dihydroorotase [Candidatus Polarisedimenticolia bacterium]